MKNLIARLFGKRSEPVPAAPAKPARTAPDIETLRQRLASANNSEERQAATTALGQALGKEGIEPAANDAEGIWIAALCACAEKPRAAGWLERIRDESSLEQVASGARLADIRLLAAQRITDVERLTRLAQQMRDRDRGVYRHCQGLVKQHAEESRRAEEVAALAQQFSQLIANRPIAAGHLYELRKQLAAMPDGPDLATCHALSRQAGEAEQAESDAQRVLEELAQEAKALWRSIDAQGLDRLDSLRKQIEAVVGKAGAQPHWMKNHPRTGELGETLSKLTARLAELDEDRRLLAECHAFLEGSAAQEVDASLEQAWNQLPKPSNEQARQTLESEWLARRGLTEPKPKPKPRKPAKPAQSAAEAEKFRNTLEALEQALETGASQQALSLVRTLDEMTAEAMPPQALTGRYHALQAQVGQVRDLVRWSTQQARDNLVAQAESLTAEGVTRVHIAEVVPKLRAEWKRLDKLSRGPQAQWLQFDEALNRAYEPILAERAERNAQQDAISQGKSALLDEAEAWLNGLSADQVNPGELQRQRQALRNHWRGMVQAGPRDERRLQARFHELMQQLDAMIQPFVQAEIERRNRLLAAARLLTQESDLRSAIDQARHLQQQWRGDSHLHLPRQLNENLWQSFREAVDAVFARRDEERKQHQARNHERDTARQSQLSAFETLLNSQPGQAQIEAGVAAFEEQWKDESAAEGRRPRRDELYQKAEALLGRARQLLRDLQSAKHQSLLDLIEQKAGWAQEHEAKVLGGEDVAEARQRLQALWQEAATLPADLEQKLLNRFESAAEMSAATLDSGSPQRQRLLIDLEILLDLPTPAAWADERRSRQLALLQTDYKSLQRAPVLLGMYTDWHAIPAGEDAEQVSRIRSVRQRLVEWLSR